MAPAIQGSEFLTTSHPEALAALLFHGIKKESATYVQSMIGFEQMLDDQSMAHLLAYLTGRFGKEQAQPSAEEVATWRERYSYEPFPRTRMKLKQIIMAAEAPDLLASATYQIFPRRVELMPKKENLVDAPSTEIAGQTIPTDILSGEGAAIVAYRGKLKLPVYGAYRFRVSAEEEAIFNLNGETLVHVEGTGDKVLIGSSQETLAEGEYEFEILARNTDEQEHLSVSIYQWENLGEIFLTKSRHPQKAKKSASRTILLSPQEEERTIVHRTFLDEAGTRAFAIGSPTGMHAIWDANLCNLRHITSGDFINAGPHWTGRGSKSELAGDIVFSAHVGFAIAELASPESPWPAPEVSTILTARDDPDPTQEVEFLEPRQPSRLLGYRRNAEGEINLTWQYGNTEISEAYRAKGGELTRSLSFSPPLSDTAYLNATPVSAVLPDFSSSQLVTQDGITLSTSIPFVVNSDKKFLLPLGNATNLTLTYQKAE